VSESYRKHFSKESKAEEYDRIHYGEGSYSEILWKIEQSQLNAILEEFRQAHEQISYLDFAAGTGRILASMENRVDVATGIEISQAMIDRARERLRKANMICVDITQPGCEIEGKYDMITSFRFILNAEPALRLAGLRALAARLKDETSILIFNNHGNLYSHKLLFWPFHKLRFRGKSYSPEGNYLTNRQVRKIADQAGLQITRIVGCGMLGGKSSRLLGKDLAAWVEERLSHLRFLRPFAGNQMYVARLKPRQS
jgi:SAM-dependent methyltransferase